jgi:CheY-like chemotaxis protein
MAKIVVLEDDASTRRLVSAVLKKAGHEVIDVDNGAEGLLIVLAEQPDLVVSDVEMPKLNGFEVLQHIREDEYTARTPVILLTSLSSEADINRGISQGANDYITKPFQPERLQQSVAKLLAQLPPKAGDSMFASVQTGAAELTFPSLPASAEELSLQPMAAPAASPVPAQAALPSAPLPPARSVGDAWAINLQVMNADALQARLAVKTWRLLLRQLFAPVSKDEAMRQADYLDLRDASLTLFFVDAEPIRPSSDGRTATLSPQSVVALSALESMVQVGAQCRRWATEQFPELAGLPVRIVVSVHRGPIEVQRRPLDFGGERDTVIGETAQLIAQIRRGEPVLSWRVLGTGAAVQAMAGLYRLGAALDVAVGSQDVVAHALMGRHTMDASQSAAASADWV